MFDFFNTLPVAVQIVIINAAFLLCIAILIIGAKNKMKLTSKFFNLSFGAQKDGCNIMRLLETSWESAWRKFEIKHIDSVKLQMNQVESSVKLLRNLLLKTYCSMLSEAGHDDPIQSDSCKSYSIILKLVEERLIDKIRFYIRENHLAERSTQEFDVYIRQRSVELRLYITDLLNDLYYFNADIKRNELYDANTKHNFAFDEIIKNSFEQCRTIAADTNNQIKRMESKDKERINKHMKNCVA